MKEDKITFSEADIPPPEVWKAHEDSINCVTFVQELNLVSSCSFDRKVYVWNPDTEKVGSLVLGNRGAPPGATLDAEQRRFKNDWKIVIDKQTRYEEELKDAAELLEEVDDMNYNDMKAKSAMKNKGIAGE